VCKNPFNEPDMKAAIKYLLSDDPKVRADIDSRTCFFKSVRAGIEAQATPTETKPRGDGISLKEAKEDMGYMGLDIDEDFLVESAATCAIVRWATVAKSAAWLAVWRRIIAFAMLYIGGLGLNENSLTVCVGVKPGYPLPGQAQAPVPMIVSRDVSVLSARCAPSLVLAWLTAAARLGLAAT
jgi:hypothetical protein